MNKVKHAVFIGIAVLFILCGAFAYGIGEGSVIEKTGDGLHDVSDGQVRLKMNTKIVVDGRVLDNIGFFNLNEGRAMQLRIREPAGNGRYLYVSPKIRTGEVLVSDRMDVENAIRCGDLLEGGFAECIAEVQLFDVSGEKTNQTNFRMTLVKKQ